MSVLTYDRFVLAASDYDADVARAPLVDRFCASSAWILSAHEAFTSEAALHVLRTDEGWAPLMRMRTVLGWTWMPLEASWGLAAPCVGADPGAVATALAEHALAHREGWDALFLSGLTRGGPAFNKLIHAFSRRHRLGLGQKTVRCVASLEGGMDGFWSRRSGRFRKNLRRDARRASDALVFERHGTGADVDASALFARIVAVEATSWKAHDGHGIHEGPMRDFYAAMVPRLAAEGRLRVTFATLEGRDVGYVLGGVAGPSYRGLQISFDRTYHAWALGNRLQLATIEGLVDEGCASYDLGTDMAYKRRWAEQTVETVPLVVR